MNPVDKNMMKSKMLQNLQ